MLSLGLMQQCGNPESAVPQRPQPDLHHECSSLLRKTHGLVDMLVVSHLQFFQAFPRS